jgi:N-methylhydantoinase A
MGRRPIWFGIEAASDTPIHDRQEMRPGHTLVGPAVIEQLDATTLVYPGDRLTVDAAANLVIELMP